MIPSGAEIFSAAWERGAQVAMRLLLAAVVLTMFMAAGRLLRPLLRRQLARRRRPSYARVFSGLFTAALAVVGSLISATIAFPSVEIADVLASLGILSVAVGFAFKDVLENLLAGVLLILRDPFQSGDEIRVGEVEGTVEGITVRETLVRTYDGRRVLIPNATVFTNVIEVQTHYPIVRSTVSIEIDVAADVSDASASLLDALANTSGVASEPPPQVHAVAIDAGVVLECRFWTESHQRRVTDARTQAVTNLRQALVDRGVPQPASAVEIRLPEAGRP